MSASSAAAAAASTAPLSPEDAADVAVLESTLFRFASTEDDKLEATLTRVLPKILPLFLRPSTPIRDGLMLICNHVFKRIKAMPTIKLPVAELLALYKAHATEDAAQAGFFVSFTLSFIEKGFARMDTKDRVKLAHELLPGLAMRAPPQQKTLLHTFFKCLSPSDYQMERVPAEELSARWVSLRASPADQKVILDFALDMLLWAPVFVPPPPRIPGMPTPMPQAPAAAAAGGAAAEEKQPEPIPDGLSSAALAVLTLDGTLPSSALQTLKSAVLHFVNHCDVFSQNQLLPLAIAGSSVGNSEVVHVGESMLKRLKSLDLEDIPLLTQLFDLYLGSMESAATPADRRRKPVNYTMKLKILNFLSRSKASVTLLQPALRVIMDTLFSPTSTAKMKNAGLMYLGWMINQIQNPAHMNSIAPVLLNALLKFLGTLAKPGTVAAGAAGAGGAAAPPAVDSDEAADAALRDQNTSSGIILSQLRGSCYQLIGQLSLKRPDLFNSNLKMLSLFFRALQEESNDTAVQNIHDGLAMLRSSYVGVNTAVQEQLQLVLLSMMSSPDKRVRLNALQCLNRLFPFQNVLARYLCLSISHEPTLDIRDESARGLVPFIPRNELEEERNKARVKREQQAAKEEAEKKKREANESGASSSAVSVGEILVAEENEEMKSPEVALDNASPSPLSPGSSASSVPPSSRPHALMNLLLPIEAARVPYPSFAETVAFAHAHLLGSVPSSADGRFSGAAVNQLSWLKTNLTFDIRALPKLLDFLAESLKQNAFYAADQVQAPTTDSGATSSMDATDSNAASSGKSVSSSKNAAGLTDEEIQTLVSRYASKLLASEATVPKDQRSLLLFQSIIEYALEQRIHDVQANASQHLVKLVSLIPELFAPVYAARLGWLESNMISGIQNLRSAMAELLGLICSHLQPDSVLSDLIGSFSKQLVAAEKTVGPSRDDVTHGSVLALGVLVAEAMRRNAAKGITYDTEDEAAREAAAFPFSQLQTIVLEIAKRLDAATFNRTPHITAAAIISLGRIGEVGRLPIPIKSAADDKAKSAAPASAAAAPAAGGAASSTAAAASVAAVVPAVVPTSRTAIVSQLLALLKGSERKAERVVEESIKTLALLCVGDKSNSLLNEVVEGFFASANTKHEELHFAVGEAISNMAKSHQHPLPSSAAAAAGAPSLSLAPPEPAPAAASSASSSSSVTVATSIPPNQDLLLSILPRLFKLINHGSALQRTGACTWLLCLVKFCWTLPAIPLSFAQIQAAFSVALTDSNQFVQEVAAKGMSILYEHSTGASQQELIDALLRTFSSGQRKVTGDTVVALDEEKGEFSTYRELVEVSKAMGKPDLVYSFMDLAAHHSIWSSKLGAAFSLSSMMQVNDKLGASLGSILPKLYRYQFDTNKLIADSMKKMWLSLVQNPREAINTHFDAIMEDLLKSTGDRQFRVRNSACLALVELLHGRGMTQLDPYLEKLWSYSFRNLDDVNEAVRKSATQLTGALSHLSIRLCDTKFSSRAAAQRAISIVLPVLLTEGVTSKAKEIQGVSFRTILALVKIGGPNLKPHLPALIGTLLESISNLESSTLQYLQFHSSAFGMTDEQLERARLSIASGGVLSEALSSCLMVVDDESIPAVLSKVTDIIATGIGLPTLTAAAKFVVSLVGSKSGPAMREHIAPLIAQLQQGLSDQSPTLRKVYADALGYLCKVARKKRVEKLLTSLLELYTSDKSSETSRLVSGFALRSIVRQAGDVVRGSFMLDVLPTVFLASHDNTPGAKEIGVAWSETLEELIPGLDAGIPQYQSECVALLTKLLQESQVYALRHIALLALKHLILACKLRFASSLPTVFPLLVKLLPGRLWTGKEVALDAMVFLAQECGTKMTAQQARQLIESLRLECARAKTEYRREAIRCVGKAAMCFPYLKGSEVIEPMKAVLQPILDLNSSSVKGENATTAAAANSAAPSAASSSSAAVVSASSSAVSDEKESGPDALLITYSYACLADLCPVPQAAVTAVHVVRSLGGSAADGVDDGDWYASQSSHLDWLMSSLLGGLDKGFSWTVRVAIWSAIKRILDAAYNGEEIAPTVVGSSSSSASGADGKKSYGPSLVHPSMLSAIATALVKNTGLGEPKFPLVKARAVECLQAAMDRPAVWSALVAPVNLAVCRELNTQLISMRADTDATVLRLAPGIQAKLATAIASVAAAQPMSDA